MKRELIYPITKTDDGKPVKEILHRHFGLSVRQVSRLKFRSDGITVDGRQVSVRYILHTGETLVIGLEQEETGSHQLIPTPGELDIRYEDEDMLVVNKPAGLVVHPSHGHYQDSLANILVYHYEQLGQNLVVRPVGRLDKDTSGLLIIAKHAAAAAAFDQQRKNGTLQRTYLALVEGRPSPASGTIQAPLGRREDSLILRQVRPDGERAVTDYEVLQSWYPSVVSGKDPIPFTEVSGDTEFPPSVCTDPAYSLVRLRLHTGRTHQIRVHMAYLGHPLLGDPFYGTEGSYGMHRTALHSYEIRCIQPFTGVALQFTCELAEDMKSYVKT
jgi:23S rRNA pseudouridine1911/1915/1917 synthase